MSSVFKSAKKIFKKVVKTVKKIAPIILIAAAVYFTAGAALAAMPAVAGATVASTAAATTAAGSAGFFGGISSAIVAGLGVTSPIIAGVINGAVTYGITGAALGGVTAAISGGDIGKGILYGGLTGAAGGAFTGAFAGQAAAASAAQQATFAAGPGGALSTAPLLDLPGSAVTDSLASRPTLSQISGQPLGPAGTVPQQVSFGTEGLQTATGVAGPAQVPSTYTGQLGNVSQIGSQNVSQLGNVSARVAGAPPPPTVVDQTAMGKLASGFKSFQDTTGITGGDLFQAGVKGVSAAFQGDDPEGRARAAEIDAESKREQLETANRLTAQNYNAGSTLNALGLPKTITAEVRPFTGGGIRKNPNTGRYEYNPRQVA
jgi:hypothetical protein